MHEPAEEPKGYENLAMLITAAILFVIVFASVNSEQIIQGIKLTFNR
jgi:hypothetical protein